MSLEIPDSKPALRRWVREQSGKMTAAERAAGSAQARALLAQQPLWQKAHAMLFFAPLPEELDVWPSLEEALAAGKTVALPRFAVDTKSYVACQVRNLDRDLQAGRFAIREPAAHCAPVALNRLDLVLVPGVAFDLQGRRLGRGKGFYDRLLSALRGPTCGVAFDQQIVRAIPVEPHDARVSFLLTPTRWVVVGQETGDRKQETGGRSQETGDRRQETGNGKRETESGDG